MTTVPMPDGPAHVPEPDHPTTPDDPPGRLVIPAGWCAPSEVVATLIRTDPITRCVQVHRHPSWRIPCAECVAACLPPEDSR